jgi:hypothetical protein
MQPLIVLMQIGGELPRVASFPPSPELCNLLITEFLTSDRAPALAPIRRPRLPHHDGPPHT